MGKHATFTFGRFNPPTQKHKLLIDSLINSAAGGDYFLFISTLQDNENNPLDYYSKISFLRILFPYISTHIVQNKKIKDIYAAAMYLKRLGYDDITFICDVNMVEKVKSCLESQNGKIYKFDSIKVVSGNVKETYSDDLVKSYIKANDIESFKKLIPNNDKLATEIFNTIKGTTQVTEVKSVIKSLVKKMLNEEDYDEKDKSKIINLKKKTANDEVREKQEIEKSIDNVKKSSEEKLKLANKEARINKSPESQDALTKAKEDLDNKKQSADNAKKATAAAKMKLSSIK